MRLTEERRISDSFDEVLNLLEDSCPDGKVYHLHCEQMDALCHTLDAERARIAAMHEVCAEAIGSEYRNDGVVEACAAHVGTLERRIADLEAKLYRALEERDTAIRERERAEAERDRWRAYVAGRPCEHLIWCAACGEEEIDQWHPPGESMLCPNCEALIECVSCGTCEPCKARALEASDEQG